VGGRAQTPPWWSRHGPSIGVDVGFRRQFEACAFGQLDHIRFVYVAGAGRGVLRLVRWQAMLDDAEDAARFQAVILP
jgi:hypothetical protein